MEVAKGYKQTEVGVIPEDWNAVRLGGYASFKTGPFGSALHKSDYTFDEIPIVNPMQIIDGDITPTPSMTIPEKLAESLSDFRLHSNDIVIGRRGDIGRCAVVNEHQNGWLCGTGSMIIKCNNRLLPDYAQRVISSPTIIASILSASVGTTMVNLNQNTLATLTIQLPPTKAEQEAIAEALSDADSLIESLQQLIAKKRQIKQGAMQELLRPKDDWVEKTLGEVAHIKTGSRNNQDKIESGEYPFFVRSATVERIDSFSHNCEAILIPGEGGIGSIFHYINGRFDVHQRVYAITQFSDNVTGKFVYLYMTQRFGAHAMENSVKATVDSLRLPTFQEFTIFLPPTIAEQNRIATILSDMDEEIATLESKLNKARQLKQGMMHNLLTGKIRLI